MGLTVYHTEIKERLNNVKKLEINSNLSKIITDKEE